MIEQDILLDCRRAARIGFDEAIFAEGKNAAQLSALVDHSAQMNQRRLFTRLTARQFKTMLAEHRSLLDYDPISCTAILGTCELKYAVPRVAIVCAGSSDIGASREALRTLAYYGHPSDWIPDVGVAGLWRLLERMCDIDSKEVVIVAAGMDGALPSVVGGLVPGVVIALPTSVGYGVGKGGRAALASALTSCSPGVVVVNIDNGYGAASAALRVLNSTQLRGDETTAKCS